MKLFTWRSVLRRRYTRSACAISDFESQGFFFTPTAIRDGVIAGYSVNLLGVYYRFFFDPGVPEDFYRYSCVHSERKRIILADQSKESMHSYAHLRKTATESSNLKAMTSGQRS